MPLNILCTVGEAYAPEAKKILESLGKVDYKTPNQKQIQTMIGTYDVAIVQLGVTYDEATLKRGTKLRIIGTATTGTDHIDLAAAKKLGIEVISLKNEIDFLKTIPSTAEHTWGLLLALMRNMLSACDDVRNGTWDGKLFVGTQLRGKTLGIVGVGRLGTIVAGYAKAFGLNVIGYDICKIPPSTCEQVSMEYLLHASDIVSLHVHLTDDTYHMIDADRLALMKPSAVLINTARGKIVDQKALLSALKRKHLAGYAADVLEQEMQFGKDCHRDPLVRYMATHHNVILTPHIGGRTTEARAATDIFIAKKLQELLGDKSG